MLPIGKETPLLRQCVNMWLAGTDQLEFTVTDITGDLNETHDFYHTVDLKKSVGNELIRLERHHKLTSRKGIKGVDGSGVGRPPRVYKKNMIFL